MKSKNLFDKIFPKFLPKSCQNLAKMCQNVTKSAKIFPDSGQKVPQCAKIFQTLKRFWQLLALFSQNLERFWQILADFGKILVRFWQDFAKDYTRLIHVNEYEFFHEIQLVRRYHMIDSSKFSLVRVDCRFLHGGNKCRSFLRSPKISFFRFSFKTYQK